MNRVEVGTVTRPHGVRGEVHVRMHHPGSDVLARVDAVWLGDSRHDVVRARAQKNDWLVTLTGVDDRDAAEALRGRPLSVDRAFIALATDEVLLADLVGCEVTDETLGSLGHITRLALGPQDCLVVRGEGVERQIPLVDALVTGIDTRARQVTVDLPEDWPEDPV